MRGVSKEWKCQPNTSVYQRQRHYTSALCNIIDRILHFVHVGIFIFFRDDFGESSSLDSGVIDEGSVDGLSRAVGSSALQDTRGGGGAIARAEGKELSFARADDMRRRALVQHLPDVRARALRVHRESHRVGGASLCPSERGLGGPAKYGFLKESAKARHRRLPLHFRDLLDPLPCGKLPFGEFNFQFYGDHGCKLTLLVFSSFQILL